MTGDETKLDELRRSAEKARDEASLVADSLTEARKQKAVKLKEGIEGELAGLGMKDCEFSVEMDLDTLADGTVRFGEKGADRVAFKISTNPGEELKSLARIASGGELSRIMLAMKGLTAVGKVPTIIFDEVDTGIGSTMASVVGKKLKDASNSHQVFCITHLPQVAAFADSHYYVVKKKTSDGRTVTRVKLLTEQERVEHIATMLSGRKPTVTTLLHARELLAGEVFVVDEEQVEASEKGKGQEQEQGQAPVGKS